MKESIQVGLVVGVIVFVVAMCWGNIFDKIERVQCFDLQRNAQIMTNFYVTPYEKEMCDKHEIGVEAEVKYTGDFK